MKSINKSSRKINTLRNTYVGVASQILAQLLNFVYRTVFIHYLNINYLGTQSLFSDIVTLLSLAELGVGTSIAYSLYKPLSAGEEETICNIMALFRKIYVIIGFTVLVAGISLTPFIEHLISEVPADVEHLHLIYILYVVNSGTSYFFSYKRILLIADQNAYIDSVNTMVFLLAQYAIQIVLLIVLQNFIVLLIVQTVITLLANISISKKADRLYPYLKTKSPAKLPATYIRDLRKRIGAMMFHKVGAVIIKGTDSILFSKFFGLAIVGLYSNYLVVEKMINVLVHQFTNAITASIGNLVSKDTPEKSEHVYDVLLVVNFWYYSFCTICMATLLNPFIEIWLGKECLLGESMAIAVAVNFYLMGMRGITLGFRDALGLFVQDRFKPIVECIINIAASIILLERLGPVGVVLGTIACRVLTTVWVEPWILYKNCFHHSPARYFAKYLSMTGFTLGMIFLLRQLTPVLFKGTILSFVLILVVYVVIIGIVLFLIFFRTKVFSEAVTMTMQMLRRKARKRG